MIAVGIREKGGGTCCVEKPAVVSASTPVSDTG